MKIMNKANVAGLLIFMLFSLVLVSAGNDWNFFDFFKECKKNCLEQKKESYNQCHEDFKNSHNVCKENFKSCKISAKEIEDREERKSFLKQCISDYYTCIKSSREILRECKKNAVEGFLNCIIECKNNSQNACRSNEDCNENEFCEKNSCGENFGQCQIKPTECIALFDPVCGCDNQTYGNDCERQKAGVSLNSTGVCL